MKFRGVISLLLVFLTVACSSPEPRSPITASKSYTLSKTVDQLKKINRLEEAKILRYIKNDSLSNYKVSPYGFWYLYVDKINNESLVPKSGNIVEVSYEILNLKNEVVYSKEELGNKKYKVDKEDFIPALQAGIKMMKQGETIKFVIPPYNAFGVVGDSNKIGINQSIICIVTLVSIKENTKNEN